MLAQQNTGHLDPFFMSLNVIGFLAIIITLAIVVVAALTKESSDRATCFILGVPGAVVASLGVNYALNPFTGTSHTTANGIIAFVQLFIGVFIAYIGIIFIKAAITDREKPAPAKPSHEIMDTKTELDNVGRKYNLIAAMQGEPECEGWYLIDHDNGGDPDPLLEASQSVDLEHERECGYLYGDPGSGLDSSSFDDTAVQSGQRGESNLAKIISHSKLEVISFWSLYGLNEERKPINADIDCVLVGVDSQRQVHAWFVDAKNYKGGADTKYVNMDVKTLVRFSISQRALIKGADGKPYIHLTRNMAQQKANWHSTVAGFQIKDEWLVCMTPAGHNGTPDVSEATWPGDIRVVTPEQLVAEIRSVDLLPIDNIPQNVFEVFASSVKMRAIREHKNVPLTPDVPRITQKTATPTATVAETAPQPAQASPATVEPNENAVQQPDEPEPAARPNYCPNCGQKLEETTNFCPNCGKPVA